MSLTRRDLIKAGVFAGATMSLPLSRVVSGQSALASRMPASKLPKPFAQTFTADTFVPPVAVPVRSTATTDYYEMSMKPTLIEVVPGYKTLFFAYEDKGCMAGPTVPGPTIKVDRHREVVVRHRNTLPNTHPTLGYVPWTSVHLHGSASLPQFDGYASDITQPGEYKNYIYPNYQPARTLWYHDHGVHHTAENAYFGCAAQYHVHDALEQSLPIPHGRYDIPLVISDALFNNDGSLLFTLEDDNGLWGDVILVNGHPWPVLEVERRKYRFRILGTAISRSWKLSLDSGDEMAVIATDGGLMPVPKYVKSFRTSSSERTEVIIDFAKYPIGRTVVLRNSSPKNNRNYANTDKVMAFRVVGDAYGDQWDNSVPEVLNPDDSTMALQPEDAVRTRKFLFHRTNGEWKINGKSWKDVESSGFQFTLANPQRGDVEIWEFDNPSGGWFHPIHAHLVDFKILDRNGNPPLPHELGPKDVVYVGENEKVRVIAEFDRDKAEAHLPYGGKYMIHCHNLIHEDHDMMGQFEVTDPQRVCDDPLGTPARDLAKEADDPL